tara:strand:+ start:144 stop:470 length:327 start_codon:yes stop_codon:yes gene_type:complete
VVHRKIGDAVSHAQEELTSVLHNAIVGAEHVEKHALILMLLLQILLTVCVEVHTAKHPPVIIAMLLQINVLLDLFAQLVTVLQSMQLIVPVDLQNVLHQLPAYTVLHL